MTSMDPEQKELTETNNLPEDEQVPEEFAGNEPVESGNEQGEQETPDKVPIQPEVVEEEIKPLEQTANPEMELEQIENRSEPNENDTKAKGNEDEPNENDTDPNENTSETHEDGINPNKSENEPNENKVNENENENIPEENAIKEETEPVDPNLVDVEENEETVSSVESIIETDLLGEELLWVLIEDHGEELLVFIKDEECELSQEVLSILQEVIDSTITIEIVDVSAVTSIVTDFEEALTMFTGNTPPLVFCKKEYRANYNDIIVAKRFGRVDLVIDPPPCPVYHIVIIGSGPGAQSVVTELERYPNKDFKVALIDWTSPFLYGSSGLLGLGPQGNLPRKMLWDTIRDVQATTEGGRLLSEESLSDCMSDLWDDATYSICHEILRANWEFRKRLSAAGIDFYRGEMEFVGKETITLNTVDEYDDYYEEVSEESSSDESASEDRSTNIAGMKFIICGGSLPRVSEFPGFENCVTIDKFLYEEELPPTALIIGNTPEVFETAHLIASYGGEVTVMNKSIRWLPNYDQECIEKVMESFSELPVKFIKISRILFIRETKTGYKVRVKLDNGKHYSRLYFTVIMDFTKIPISSHINIEAAGVQCDCLTHKMFVNGEFKTTNPSIWAFGGVARRHLGTPYFEILAGKRVINMILTGVDSVPMQRFFPRVLLTPLEYGFVGETEKSARIKYKNQVTVYEAENQLLSFDKTSTSGPVFQIKIICTDHWHCFHREKLEKVIGIHFLGKNASRLITGFAASLEKGLTKREFAEQLSIKSSTELGVFQTELQLKNVLEKKLNLSPNREVIKKNDFLKRNIPYRSTDEPPYTTMHMAHTKETSSEVSFRPDANQPIHASPVTDLWAIPETISSTSSSYTTFTSSFQPKHFSDSSSECDPVDREPSFTTIYTSYTQPSEPDSLPIQESSDTDSDAKKTPLMPCISSTSSLEDDVSQAINQFDGRLSPSLPDNPNDTSRMMDRTLKFSLALFLLPLVIGSATEDLLNEKEIFIHMSELDSGKSSNTLHLMSSNRQDTSEESSHTDLSPDPSKMEL